jgi:chromatin remodeling complex protein RSC6
MRGAPLPARPDPSCEQGWTCGPTSRILPLHRIRKSEDIQQAEVSMAEEKGLNKPVKLKADLAALLGAGALPRTEITRKLWDYIKANKLQTSTVNGKPENAGKYIVADAKLIRIFNNTRVKTKSGKVVDFTGLKEGQTIDMMQMASVVSANIE